MKQIFRLLSAMLLVILVMGVMLVAVGCGGDNNDPPPDEDPPTTECTKHRDRDGDNKCDKCGAKMNAEPDHDGDIAWGMSKDGINWTIDDEFVLTLEPAEKGDSADMDDYEPQEKPDWAPYAQYVRSLEIGDGVTSIGNYAFADLKWLNFAIIGEDVESIGKGAFEGCYSLMSAYVGGSVDEIGENAFRHCYRLKEVASSCDLTLKAGSSDHGMLCYYALAVEEDSQSYLEDDNGFVFVENKDGWYLVGYTQYMTENEVVLPDDADGENYSIASYAFMGNETIQVLDLGGAKEVLSYAFSGDLALKSVTIPSGVVVQKYAFRGNRTVEEIKCSSKDLMNNAFEECLNLRTASVSGDVPTGLFRKCEKLHTVTLSSTKVIHSAAFYGCTALQTVKFPSSLTTIGDYAFYMTALPAVVIPDKVTTIGSKAFDSCGNLSSVTIGAGVTSIGVDAFDHNNGLYEVINLSALTVEAGQETHGKVAFYAKVVHTGPDSRFTKKDGFVFFTYSDASNKTYAVLVGYEGATDTIQLPSTFDGSSYAIGQRAFYGMDIGSLVFPDSGITSIGYQAFANTKIGGTITIPGSVETIGTEAFLGSTVQHVIASSGVKYIGDGAFKNCYSLCLFQHTGVHTIKTIGIESFYNSGLVSFTMPSSLTKVGGKAFKGCYSLIEVISNGSTLEPGKGTNKTGYMAMYAKTVAAKGTKSKIENKDGFLFYEASDGIHLVGYVGESKILVLPKMSYAYSVDAYAFYGRSDIEAVAIPNNCTINSYAFAHCENLSVVYLAKKVSKVSAYAFDYASPSMILMTDAGKDNRDWQIGWNCAESSYVVIPDAEADKTDPDDDLAPAIGTQINKVYYVNYGTSYDLFLAIMGLTD